MPMDEYDTCVNKYEYTIDTVQKIISDFVNKVSTGADIVI